MQSRLFFKKSGARVSVLAVRLLSTGAWVVSGLIVGFAWPRPVHGSSAATPPLPAESHAVPDAHSSEDKGSSTQQGAGTKSAEGWFKSRKPIKSAPRLVKLPPFEVVESALLQPSVPSAAKSASWPHGRNYNYGASRFSVIVATASWSARAIEVASLVNGWQPDFSKRSVSIVGIFTHDAPDDIASAIKRNQLSFPVSKANLTFVSQLLNPKVPTVWVCDHTGQVLMRLERPTDAQLSGLRLKMLEWTDF